MMASLNNLFRFAKEAMGTMFDWYWRPVGAMATPTLTRNLKPNLFAGAARRGGLHPPPSRVVMMRRDVECGAEEQEELESDEDSSVDDGPIFTLEETE